jgi:hypothetical protein
MTRTDTPMTTAHTQEAFTNVLDLVNRYDIDTIIEALSLHAEFESQDEQLDLYHRLLAAFFYA